MIGNNFKLHINDAEEIFKISALHTETASKISRSEDSIGFDLERDKKSKCLAKTLSYSDTLEFTKISQFDSISSDNSGAKLFFCSHSRSFFCSHSRSFFPCPTFPIHRLHVSATTLTKNSPYRSFFLYPIRCS